jgi:hypothetical protein
MRSGLSSLLIMVMVIGSVFLPTGTAAEGVEDFGIDRVADRPG